MSPPFPLLSPLRWDRVGIVGWNCYFSSSMWKAKTGFFPSFIGQALCRLNLKFLLKADLVKNRLLWHSCKLFLLPCPARSRRGFFSDVYYAKLVELQEVKGTKVHSLPTHNWVLWCFFFFPQICPVSLQQFLTVWVSLQWHWFLKGFLLVAFCSVSAYHSSQFLGSGVLCNLTYLTDLRRVVNFILFSFLLVRIQWLLPRFLHSRLETHQLHF